MFSDIDNLESLPAARKIEYIILCCQILKRLNVSHKPPDELMNELAKIIMQA